MERKLKVLDLFAGIGGFALGLDSTGFFKTVKFVEKDKYCQKVLRKNFPNIPIEEDIKDVKGKRYEADVIVGGFPCQPMSVAGKRKGTDDDRYLWPEMFRLIREIKPEFVIGENVQGIINLQNGMVLRQVQDQLESEGFEVQCFLIPASGIGAWHQRYRVWIVAHSQHNGLLRAVARVDEEKNKVEEKHRKENSSTGKSIRASSIWKTDNGHENVSNTENRIGQSTEWQGRESIRRGSDDRIWSKGERENIETNVSNTNNTRGGASKYGIEQKGQKTNKRWEGQSQFKSSGHSKNVPNTTSKRLEREFGKKLQGARVRSTNSSEESGENKVWRFYSGEKDVTNTNEQRTQVSTERGHTGIEMSGGSSQKTWWQTQSELCGVPNGISYELDKDRANRIKTLGNAIVPQIAREFGLAIKKVLADEDII